MSVFKSLEFPGNDVNDYDSVEVSDPFFWKDNALLL